jgi:tetraacyldisaccharide 4'-kinase
MFSQDELQRIWYGDREPSLTLQILAALYGGATFLRRELYARHLLPRARLPVPVVVVGNITVGGAGKTPLVIALVEALRARGFKPGVISRGYGGNASHATLIDAHSDPAVVGDEARLVFDAAQVPVAVGRDRIEAGRVLLESAHVNVIVADDGLQHYRLERDVEICVVDGERRYGNGRLLPAGPLREPLSRLASVTFRVCNGAMAQTGEEPMRLSGGDAVGLDDPTQRRALSTFSGTRVHGVAGIGNPGRFFAQLRGAGIEVIEHAFADHHPFVAQDLEFDDDIPVFMTEKDAVKCRAFARPNQWQVPVRAELSARFFDDVAKRLQR